MYIPQLYNNYSIAYLLNSTINSRLPNIIFIKSKTVLELHIIKK